MEHGEDIQILGPISEHLVEKLNEEHDTARDFIIRNPETPLTFENQQT